MEYYPAWPLLLGLAAMLAIAATPLLKLADEPPSATPDRVPTIDGLRGFLALGVLFHHAALYHRWLDEGVSAVPPTPLYALAGEVGVSIFFMITGFLFWGKIVRRNGRMNWPAFYLGRAFRIGPLYYAAVAAMYLLVFYRSDWSTQAPWLETLSKWLLLGYYNGGPVNGQSASSMLLGMVWTLHWEWLFYAAILPLSLFAGRFHLAAAGAVVAGGLAGTVVLSHGPATWAALFGVGIVAASLSVAKLRLPRFPDWLLSSVACAFAAILFLSARSAYAPLPVLLMAGFFACIISGATLFGLLTSRPAIRLGNISFGIYLLHGLALSVVYEPLKAIALQSPVHHWGLAILAAAIVVLVAAAAHVLIERPGIAAGKLIARRWSKARTPSWNKSEQPLEEAA